MRGVGQENDEMQREEEEGLTMRNMMNRHCGTPYVTNCWGSLVTSSQNLIAE
jgi:hypothetical protein